MRRTSNATEGILAVGLRCHQELDLNTKESGRFSLSILPEILVNLGSVLITLWLMLLSAVEVLFMVLSVVDISGLGSSASLCDFEKRLC